MCNRLNICVFVFAFTAAPVTSGTAAPFITGYAGNWSNESGQPAEFFLSGEYNPNATLTIYDVLSTPLVNLEVALEEQTIDPANLEPWRNGYGWEPTTLDLPDLPSGLYYLNGPKVGRDYVPFLVTEPREQKDIVVVYPTNTVNAYSHGLNFNPNFGQTVSLYSRGKDGARPQAVSFQRPQNQRVNMTAGFDKWLLENHPGSFKYISQADLENYDSLAGAKLVVIPGHSEYWTASSRRNFDRFVDNGGSALVISGNTMYRAVELDNPTEPTELRFSPRLHFTDPRLEYPTWESIGADFAHAGFGAVFRDARESINSPYDGWKLLDVSPSYFEGTGLEVGDIIHGPSAEYDGVPFTDLDPETGPVIDHELLDFHRIDLIAFENTLISGRNTAGTWIDFNKTADSGRVINVAAMTWSQFAGDRRIQKQLTANMVDLLLIEQADFDDDELLSSADIDLLFQESNEEDPRMRFDLTEDGKVDNADVDRWLADFAGTWYGDANFDRTVDFGDFLTLAVNFDKAGGWKDGDFTGNGRVTLHDFLFLADNFKTTHGAAAVPEPDTLAGPCMVALAVWIWIRRRYPEYDSLFRCGRCVNRSGLVGGDE